MRIKGDVSNEWIAPVKKNKRAEINISAQELAEQLTAKDIIALQKEFSLKEIGRIFSTPPEKYCSCNRSKGYSITGKMNSGKCELVTCNTCGLPIPEFCSCEIKDSDGKGKCVNCGNKINFKPTPECEHEWVTQGKGFALYQKCSKCEDLREIPLTQPKPISQRKVEKLNNDNCPIKFGANDITLIKFRETINEIIDKLDVVNGKE
jgi:hypothetical protein